MQHEGGDTGDHAEQHGQSRRTGSQIHGQLGNAGDEGHEQKAAAHAKEGRDAGDNHAAQEGNQRVERKFHAAEGELAGGKGKLDELDARGHGSAFGLALGGSFKSLGGFLGLGLGTLTDWRGFPYQVQAQHQHEKAKIALVRRKVQLASGQRNSTKSAHNGAKAKGKAQGQHKALHAVVAEGTDNGRKTGEHLVRSAHRVGNRLVERGFAKRLGIRAKAVHGHVAHASHNAAKSAHGGENPAHPQGPAKGQNHVDLGAAGNTQIAGFGLHVQGFRGGFHLFGYGIGKHAAVGGKRGAGGQHRKRGYYAQKDPFALHSYSSRSTLRRRNGL